MKKVVKYVYSAMYQRNREITFLEKTLITVTTLFILFLAMAFPLMEII